MNGCSDEHVSVTRLKWPVMTQQPKSRQHPNRRTKWEVIVEVLRDELDSPFSAMLRDLDQVREWTATEGTLSASPADVAIPFHEALHGVEMSPHGDDQGCILEASTKNREHREIRRDFPSRARTLRTTRCGRTPGKGAGRKTHLTARNHKRRARTSARTTRSHVVSISSSQRTSKNIFQDSRNRLDTTRSQSRTIGLRTIQAIRRKPEKSFMHSCPLGHVDPLPIRGWVWTPWSI